MASSPADVFYAKLSSKIGQAFADVEKAESGWLDVARIELTGIEAGSFIGDNDLHVVWSEPCHRNTHWAAICVLYGDALFKRFVQTIELAK